MLTHRMLRLVLATALTLLAARASSDDLQELIDRAAIEELVSRYVIALDELDAETYANVFAEDAVYEVPGAVHEGREAIRQIVVGLQESRARNEASGTPSPRLYHVMSVSSIEIVDESHARHQSYAQTVRAAENGQFVVGFMGKYEDELVKKDGRWFIQSRKLVSFVNQ